MPVGRDGAPTLNSLTGAETPRPGYQRAERLHRGRESPSQGHSEAVFGSERLPREMPVWTG